LQKTHASTLGFRSALQLKNLSPKTVSKAAPYPKTQQEGIPACPGIQRPALSAEGNTADHIDVPIAVSIRRSIRIPVAEGIGIGVIVADPIVVCAVRKSDIQAEDSFSNTAKDTNTFRWRDNQEFPDLWVGKVLSWKKEASLNWMVCCTQPP
jgi:hypothetical protein